MIEVSAVLARAPRFERYVSVDELEALVAALADCPGCEVAVAGRSVDGRPIHHVRVGGGRLKAMFVGFPHCSEPVGGLTVASLLMLLRDGEPALLDADVEWHIIPCADPDGALLNEAWSLAPFSLERHLRGFYKQELRFQAECSFPIRHERLVFDQPTVEALVLKSVIDRVKPDFYYSLHNQIAGGGYFQVSRPLRADDYAALRGMLTDNGIAVQVSPPNGEASDAMSDGITPLTTTAAVYDLYAATSTTPEDGINFGACSYEYALEVNPGAFSFISEVPYLSHPCDGSATSSGENFRLLLLKLDAERKHVAAAIIDEWVRFAADVDPRSPFYRKVYDGIVALKEKLPGGLPWWPYSTRDLLLNPEYGRDATEGERFAAYVATYYVVCNCHEVIRLLDTARQTPAVVGARARLAAIFDEVLDRLSAGGGFDRCEVFHVDALARAQLGSGLIALGALLAGRAAAVGR